MVAEKEITWEDVRAARKKLSDILKRPSWLCGIGISLGKTGSLQIKVNVEVLTDTIYEIVPKEIDGVPVVLEEVGSAWPL